MLKFQCFVGFLLKISFFHSLSTFLPPPFQPDGLTSCRFSLHRILCMKQANVLPSCRLSWHCFYPRQGSFIPFPQTKRSPLKAPPSYAYYPYLSERSSSARPAPGSATGSSAGSPARHSSVSRSGSAVPCSFRCFPHWLCGLPAAPSGPSRRAACSRARTRSQSRRHGLS